mmetsp:Transcript_13930/g.22418  ORF Transcript_13930/g.22418 Transcript_13930/m.22418 type:complete len:303 (+) Transcript_13930:296-1204(+)|eukprot:CAMPEP_0178763622 /NCGR_PEP_ID=MMETSP0744-20121128/17284_1 /TAXON_ID=913974 /ORGANISM="Nitzschia punctata, Strain CCMP561" /LENGTH=302 /DNA_ID=CAMNT_0020418599 /DNA_START=142 /DNA_END=1050 /DNA_ORIENTATION=+
MVPSLLTSATFGGGFMPSKTLPSQKLEECRDLYLQGKSEHTNKNFVDAVRLFLKAVYMQESLLGKYHQDTIKTYWRLGRAACMAKQDQQAVEAFHRAMRMAEITFEDTVVKSLMNDVHSCWEEVDLTEQQPEEDRAPSRSSSPSPVQDLEKILALEKAADAACKNKNFESAAQSYQEALDLLAVLVGNRDTLCGADLLVKQSTCLLRISKITEASRALSSAHECYLRRLGGDHPATLGAAANLKSVQILQQKNALQTNDNGKNGSSNGDKKGMWWTASLSSLGSNSNSKNSFRQESPSSPTP